MNSKVTINWVARETLMLCIYNARNWSSPRDIIALPKSTWDRRVCVVIGEERAWCKDGRHYREGSEDFTLTLPNGALDAMLVDEASQFLRCTIEEEVLFHHIPIGVAREATSRLWRAAGNRLGV